MSAPTRRERVRAQTLDEIKQHAYAQVAEGGAAALSLNAIAKAMGMSGPALYRYFTSRDELLAALVTDGYRELADAVVTAGAEAARRTPERRLAAMTAAYRGWALAHPQTYALLFAPRPAGFADPEEGIDAMSEAMRSLLGALAELAAGAAPRRNDRLDAQLLRWSERRNDGAALPPLVLRLGVLTWTRMHGIVSLELAGVLGDMGLDAALLLEAEVGQIADTGGR